jgi:tetratricopeptide (TPR) repeat protein
MQKFRLFVPAVLAGVMTSVSVAFALPAANAPASPDSAMSASPKPPDEKPQKSAKKLNCKRGDTAKLMRKAGKKRWVCVKLKADVLPDAELYQQARMLADTGEYEWALDHLRLISNQNDVEVLNYTGYSNRKAGRLETGIQYYYKALAIDPNYIQAREYLGEAYILAGREDLARVQLDEISKRGGKQTEAFQALQRALAAHDI